MALPTPQDTLGPNSPSADIHSKERRQGLARMIMQLFQHWQLGNEEQLDLLGLDAGSRTTLARYRKGQPLGSNRDLLDRVGHLLSIHKSLRLLFPHNRELAYAWMRTPNRAFDNLSPVQVVRQHGFAGLLMLRSYLDQARGQ